MSVCEDFPLVIVKLSGFLLIFLKELLTENLSQFLNFMSKCCFEGLATLPRVKYLEDALILCVSLCVVM